MDCHDRQSNFHNWLKGLKFMTGRKTEILAPAGSYACFQAAVQAGADAVYAGGPKFGARAYADNFTEDELILAIREAHVYGVRFYLTVNILLKDQEMEELYDYLAPLYENGLDAVIVQDIGAFDYIRAHFPDLDVHVSTQMTVTGADSASFLEERGAVRVVPARELSLEEIREIRANTNLEIECFVHGALCYCYSGQCLMSSMIGGRSGNRGQCAQPCRLPYTVGGEKKHFLSLKDICTLELIPDLIEAGIDSFKIEGRMKKPEYVAGVTSIYRKYVDQYLRSGRKDYTVSEQDRERLMDLYNRGGSHTGYFTKHNGEDMLSLARPNHAGVAAVKMTGQKGREVHGIAITRLNKGDVIETGRGKENYTVGKAVRKGDPLSFLVPKGMFFPKGTVFHRIRNNQVIEEIKTQFCAGTRKRPVTGTLFLEVGSPAYLTVTCDDTNQGDPEIVTVMSDTEVQKAQSRPLEEEQIRAKILKTGNTPFNFQSLDIEMRQPIFLPVQELNRLRREALEQLKTALEEKDCRAKRAPAVMPKAGGTARSIPEAKMPELSILVESIEQLVWITSYLHRHPQRIERVYADCHMKASFFEDKEVCSLLRSLRSEGTEVYAALPHIFRLRDKTEYLHLKKQSIYPYLDGVLVRSLEEIRMLERIGFDKNMILDHNLYVFNRFAKNFWFKNGFSEFTAPAELTREELETLGIQEAECIVYGRLPVMVSAQCIIRTRYGCQKESGITWITDRYGNDYPVRNHCDSCYNVIYQPDPLCLSTFMEEIKRLSPRALRLQFSVENTDEMEKVLQQFEHILQCGNSADAAGITAGSHSWSEGHFRRGVI